MLKRIRASWRVVLTWLILSAVIYGLVELLGGPGIFQP